MTQHSDFGALTFSPADLNTHLETCIRFRADTFVCGFGSADRFYGEDGKGVESYITWVKEKAAALAGSVVHVWDGEQIIGQIEMGLVPNIESVGYVNLFYLTPQYRGRGLGALLEAYAWKYLGALGCTSLRLSASLTNTPAWQFYQRNGWEDLGPRDDDPTVRKLQKHGKVQVPGGSQVINPDDYLETASGREFTPERNIEAWAYAYERFSKQLAQAPAGVFVYLVMGVQGAGKSHWVSQNLGRLGHRAIAFDAALPARRHREKLLSIAREHGAPVIAIFVKASLEQALSRNAGRTPDKRVPEEALKSVFSLIESPTEAEGFLWVETIDDTRQPAVLQVPSAASA